MQLLSPQANAVIGMGDPLPLRVTTPDKDVLRIALELKGLGKIRSFTRAGQPLTSGNALKMTWMGAKRLKPGRYTLVATALDGQQNRGTAEVGFTVVNPAKMKSQRTKFGKLRLLGKGRKRTLTGRLTTKLPFKISGHLRVEWQNRRHGKWKKIHGGAYNASKPFKFKQKLKYRGKWRVRVRYTGKRPFKSSRSKWITFKV